jgi:hypothetical protein
MPLSLELIQTIKSQRDYRIGDILYRWGLKWEESMNNILHDPMYTNTILREYLIENNGNATTDPKLLGHIIMRHGNKKGIGRLSDTIAIHIRAGDVISVPHRFLSIDYISKIEMILASNPDPPLRVLLVICFAYGNFYERNLWEYCEKKQHANELCLQILFDVMKRRLGNRIELDIHSSIDADDDLIVLFNAEHFICDSGGFSKAIAEARDAHARINY